MLLAFKYKTSVSFNQQFDRNDLETKNLQSQVDIDPHIQMVLSLPAALLTHPIYGANLLRELPHPQLDVYFFVPNIIRDRKQTKSQIGIRFVRKLDTSSYPNQS